MPTDERIFQYLNTLKSEGLRPTLICAIMVKGKVGLFSSNHYPGWEFLQGGIGFNELPIETFEREVAEELGYTFYQKCHFPPKRFDWLFEAQLKTKIKDKVLTIEGVEVKPTAKHYIVFAAEMDVGKFPEINADDFAFSGTTVKLHNCKWVGYEEAINLIKKIPSPNKREIIRKVLDKLKDKGLL
jgi:8-oxo-dGTP pyrophosphatase MutT (NUDIX family)